MDTGNIINPNNQASSLAPINPVEPTNKTVNWHQRLKKFAPWIAVVLISLLLPLIGALLALFFIIYGTWKHKRPLYKLAAVAFIAAVIGLGSLYVYRTVRNDQILNYQYSKLDDYTLTSKLTGAKMTFQKPAEIKQTNLRLQEGSVLATLIHVNKKTKPESGVAYIYASSVQSALATSKEYVASVKEGLDNPTSKNRETMLTPIKQFIEGNTSKRYDIKITNVSAYTSDNIKNSAWRFDFTINNDKNINKISPVKGYVVLAIGERTFYYFMVTAPDYIWQPNEKIWQQVLASIKVDQ